MKILPVHSNCEPESLSDALNFAFDWSATDEGISYWDGVDASIRNQY